MEISFECLDYDRWYVVFSEYEGDYADLEMVEGADEFIDMLSDDGLYLTLDVNLEEPSIGDYFTLEIEAHDEDGAFYNVKNCNKFSGTIWLCNVVHEFFGNHPEIIYCSEIK